MSRDDAWLLDIIYYAKLALEFTEGMDDVGFAEDLKTQAAVTRTIEVIGEAAKRLSPEFRSAHPDLPLREAAGMRDRVIHEYDRVVIHRLWEVVRDDLPDLIEKLEPLVPEEPS